MAVGHEDPSLQNEMLPTFTADLALVGCTGPTTSARLLVVVVVVVVGYDRDDCAVVVDVDHEDDEDHL